MPPQDSPPGHASSTPRLGQDPVEAGTVPAYVPLKVRCPSEETWPLAPVFWEDGQVLRPEHLTTQEASQLHLGGLSRLSRGLPAYGILSVEWDDQALTQGLFSLKHLILLLESGELVALNANASARGYSLAEAGAVQVDIILNIVSLSQPKTDAPLYHGTRALFGRRFYEVRPAAQPQVAPKDGARRLTELFLARFIQQTDGRWMLYEGQLPTLLLLGSSPFLLTELEGLRSRLTSYARLGESAMRSRLLSNESVAAIRSYLRRSYRLLATFNNLAHEVYLHPYELYEQIREFYIELALYHNRTPELAIVPYAHEHLSECMIPLLKALRDLLNVGPGKNVLEFTLENRRFVLRDLSRAVTDSRVKREVFLVVRRAQLGDALELKAIKLASPRRLQLVHEQALRGLGLTRLDRPPAGAPFEPGVEFLRIEPNDEWQYVQSERALAFFEPPGTGEFLAALYWA